jgi:hypothetical protein
MRTQYDGWIDEDLGKLAASRGWNIRQTQAARRHLLARADYSAAAAWNLLLQDAQVRAELDVAADAAAKS